MNPLWGAIAVWAFGPIVLAVGAALRDTFRERRR